jgi:hypothetical protein
MEYTWKHGIQIVPNQTFKTDDPLEVGKILVDLCTGDKYKILPVEAQRLAEGVYATLLTT